MTAPRFEIPLHYTEALLRRAARHWWWRDKGAAFWVTMAVVLACFAVVVWDDGGSWVTGVYGTAIVVFAGLMAAVYVLPLRRSLAVYRRMDDGASTLRLGADAFEVESAAGRVELPWTAVAEVETHPDVWLVIYSRSQFSTLPAGDLSVEARSFLLERVQAAGGASSATRQK